MGVACTSLTTPRTVIFLPFPILPLSCSLLAIVINQAGKEWKKYSVTVDIPVNVLVKFVFKLCAGANNQLTGYNATATDNVIYVFSKVRVRQIEEGSDIQVHLTGVSITQNGDNIPTGDICRHHE